MLWHKCHARKDKAMADQNEAKTKTIGADVCRSDPSSRTLAWFAYDRIRMPTADHYSQRARSCSCRTNRPRRERKRHRIPNSFIQQDSDLTKKIARAMKRTAGALRQKAHD